MSVDHLDEGPIHAWLDGALAEADAASVEAHVMACAECQAAVAEARGLMAMGSAILAKLDDVPEHVIPRRTTARRHRSIRSWPLQALAAGLVVAIGITVFHRSTAIEIPPMAAPEIPAAPFARPVPIPAPRARTTMSSVAVPKPVVPTSAVGGGSSANVSPPASVGAVSSMADATVPAMAKTEAVTGPQRRIAPSPPAVRARAAGAAMVPRLASRCDALRKTVAHADSLLQAGVRDTTVSPAQRDSVKACPP